VKKIKKQISKLTTGAKNKVPENWQPHLTRKNIIIGVIVAFFLIQYFQVARMTGGLTSLSLRGSSLVDEVGKLTEVSQMIGEDLNEVRGYLLLPTRQYSSSSDSNESPSVSDENENELQISLFKYVGYLGDIERKKAAFDKNYAFLGGLASNSELSYFLEDKGLILGQISDKAENYYLEIMDSEVGKVLSFTLNKETGDMVLEAASDSTSVVSTDTDEFAGDVLIYLRDNLSTILTNIKKIEASNIYIVESFVKQEMVDLLAAEQLTFVAEPTQTDSALTFDIQNIATEVVAQVILSLEDFSITLHDSRDDENIVLQVTDLATSLPPFIEKLDVLPAVQKNIIEAQLVLAETFEDNGFKLLLEENSLYVNNLAREDEYRFYYDIFYGDASGVLLGSIVIEKSSGLVEVVGPEGADTMNLLFFEEGLKKKL
jgi:hypothetical protein